VIWKLVSLILVLLVGEAFGSSTIRLLPNARVNAGEPVLLEDIAQLDGAEALRLAAVVVTEDPAVADGASTFLIERAEVHARLQAAGAKWAEVALTGSGCRVMPIDMDGLGAKPIAKPTVERTPAGEAWRTQENTGTLLAAVGLQLSSILGVRPEDLRVFPELGDGELLATAVAGRNVQIRPMGSGERIPLSIAVFEDGGVAIEESIRVTVRVRREVTIATDEIGRGRVIGRSNIETRPEWVAPDVAPVPTAEIVGAETARAVRAGEVIDDGALVSPIAIERGDRVSVRCVTRGIVVRTEAHALEDGRVGEMIRLRPVGADRRAPGFDAKVEGPGRAIVFND